MDLGISQALAAAVADGSVAEFLSDLTSSGGRVVAGMLEGAVEAAVGAEKKKDDGREEGRGASAFPAAAAAASAAAAAHERLHSGPWHAVPAAWRDAYTLACLLQAEGEGEEGRRDGDDEARRRRMRLLDLALLLGGRRFRAPAHAAAAALSAAARLSPAASLPPPLPEAWPPPATPVELPPGSLGGSELGRGVEALLPRGGGGGGAGAPPSLEDFVSAVRPSAPPRPLLLPRVSSSWPAFDRWTSPRYWDRVAGARTVPVEVGGSYLEEGWSQELQTLRAFLETHVLFRPSPGSPPPSSAAAASSPKTGYLAQHDLLEQVPALAGDVLTPDYALALASCSCPSPAGRGEGSGGEGEGDGVARNLWLGPARTLSPLHTDPKRNLLCQVFGKKYVRLYRPEESSEALRLAGREREGEDEGEGGNGGEGSRGGGGEGVTESLTAANTSRADLFSPSPSVAALRFFDIVLTPGDALYIPEGWWHFVLSLEASASVSFWF